MRKKARRTDEEAAWELLGAAPAVHLASTTPDGAPLVRVHARSEGDADAAASALAAAFSVDASV